MVDKVKAKRVVNRKGWTLHAEMAEGVNTITISDLTKGQAEILGQTLKAAGMVVSGELLKETNKLEF